MKYSREQRAESRQQQHSDASSTGETSDDTGTVFFWREYEEPIGFLCQWFACYFRDPDVHPTHVFNCTEQYMMYRKALVIAKLGSAAATQANATPTAKLPMGSTPRMVASRRSDVAHAQDDRTKLPGMILREEKPGRQKMLARSVRFTDEQLKTWERIKFEVVEQGNYCKFLQHADLGARLLATGDRELVEASPQDTVWGIGFAAEFAEHHRTDWGSNLLGKALMSVRARLRAEKEAAEADEVAERQA